ncbi:hypothetical protein TNCV_4038691 [Trichonephila clavipes]|nr:hypothetical protein TNCV_4038691 [Trichonephila clavipes]
MEANGAILHPMLPEDGFTTYSSSKQWHWERGLGGWDGSLLRDVVCSTMKVFLLLTSTTPCYLRLLDNVKITAVIWFEEDVNAEQCSVVKGARHFGNLKSNILYLFIVFTAQVFQFIK